MSIRKGKFWFNYGHVKVILVQKRDAVFRSPTELTIAYESYALFHFAAMLTQGHFCVVCTGKRRQDCMATMTAWYLLHKARSENRSLPGDCQG